MIIKGQSLANGAIWQIKIGLHQFKTCLSKVAINVTTINNSSFSPYS